MPYYLIKSDEDKNKAVTSSWMTIPSEMVLFSFGMHAFVCMCLYMCMHVCVYMYMCMCICVCECVHMHEKLVWRPRVDTVYSSVALHVIILVSDFCSIWSFVRIRSLAIRQ